jgi:hypothetical protein
MINNHLKQYREYRRDSDDTDNKSRWTAGT